MRLGGWCEEQKGLSKVRGGIRFREREIPRACLVTGEVKNCGHAFTNAPYTWSFKLALINERVNVPITECTGYSSECTLQAITLHH